MLRQRGERHVLCTRIVEREVPVPQTHTTHIHTHTKKMTSKFYMAFLHFPPIQIVLQIFILSRLTPLL